ncbi:PorV/PorQ family protein [candidate division KSB1 bacterium]|nr:PorV/PorQ family protein [candidate division KSB1 bacterium]
MKNLTKSLLFFFFLASSTQLLFSQTKGFAFLKQVMPARAVAMGGALHAIKNDPGAIKTNPAALAGITERMSTFSYVNYILDVNGGEGVYVHPLENGNLAGSFYYQDYGSFDGRDELNESQGSFSASSVALTIAYASQYKAALWYGVSAKYFRSAISDYSSSGFAVDAALFYQSPLLHNLNIGLGIYNLGTVQNAFIDTKDDIPTSIELGLSKVLAHLPLEWSLAFKNYIGEDFVVALGGEFTLNPNMFVRFGYNSNGKDQKITFDKNRIAGFSTGIGLHFGNYTVDYALASMGGLGSVNQFTFGMKF